MRKPLIAGNWKMNHSPSKAIEVVKDLLNKGPIPEDVDPILIPSFPSLYPLYQELKDSKIQLGAQTMSFEDAGAFTGEVSWDMLVDVGVKYVLIGHSERRQYYHENNPEIIKKLGKAIENQLIPILCVGESLQERENGRATTKVEGQLHRVLKGLKPEDMEKVIIAYEPIWAIGTGKTASPEDAEEMAQVIRHWVQEIFGEEIAQKVRILYGGSVKPENIKEIMEKENIDGALVGGASLKADDFYTLLELGGQK
ncbi:MAG: triose-phosphate isomerase [Tissierellia bacterium]|nr:triose-phosphate isomerase [Tissierellia bacterium]